MAMYVRGRPMPLPLTPRQWLQQTLPYDLSIFGPTPSRRNTGVPRDLAVVPWHEFLPSVRAFVPNFDDTDPNQPSIQDPPVADISEVVATASFYVILKRVGQFLDIDLSMAADAPVRSSPGRDLGADQLAASMASSPVQRADFIVSVDGKQVLVVEMKRPAVFRKNVTSPIPDLSALANMVANSSTPIADSVSFEPVLQLFGYMNSLNLGYGILSSYDLTYVFHREGRYGETLFVSEGISCTSPDFLGVLAYILWKAQHEPRVFERPAPEVIAPTTALGSLKGQGPKGSQKGKKSESGKRQLRGPRTRSQGLPEMPETPAESLHLARHHFAIGWSGKIVQGTYEGQRVVVKLAPIGSERAEALVTEVTAYHMMEELWGKYVPQLVSYGTTVGGTIMYIATEEITGHEIEMGTLSREVVKELFYALTAVHQCGILHGDIRPSNILVAKGQQAGVRLIDFGFARFVTSDEGRNREYAQLESLVREFTFPNADGTSQIQLEQSQVV